MRPPLESRTWWAWPATSVLAAPPRGDRCCKVLVNGVKYTCLAWFLNKGQPYPRHRHAVLGSDQARSFAIQMRFGDGKTLSSQGLAKAPPEHAREILADDETICTSRWAKTKCDVEVKLCSRVTDLSHKLFRVEDLLSIPELNG